ncbi:MAG: FecR family protein [Myxococcota bacterium]
MSLHNHPRRCGPTHGGRARVIAVALFALFAIAPSQGPHIEQSTGKVELGRGDPLRWQPAQTGDLLAPGDAVRTGRDGRVELDLGTATVRLYGDSLLRVPTDAMEPAGTRAVGLERGHSLFDVLHDDSGFEVRTPEVVVSVKGTRFLVDVAGRLASVSVYRGLVGLRTRGTGETLVREGFFGVGGPERPFELFLHDAADPWNSWSSGEDPPDLPQHVLKQAGSVQGAVLGAQRKARAVYQHEALDHAIRRRPEISEHAGTSVKGRRDLERDPMVDAANAVRKQTLEIPFVEAIVNNPPGGGGGGFVFDISLVSGTGTPGGDRVDIDSSSGTSWTFDEVFLIDVLSGTDVLPASLATELQTQGINDPTTFVAGLKNLF